MQVFCYAVLLLSIASIHGASRAGRHGVTAAAEDSNSVRRDDYASVSLSITSGSSHSKHQERPTFCVAPLPEEFMVDEENLKTYDPTLEGCGDSADTTRSLPFGHVLSHQNDIFRTNQFSLEYIFRKLMIESPLVSESCETADIVFVPLTVLCQPKYKEVQDNIARFTKDPGAFLPFVKVKPHFIALPRCLQYTDYFEIDDLRRAGLFAFLTIEPRPDIIEPDIIVVPYPARYHHHSGLARNRFIAHALQPENKEWLAYENFYSSHDETGLRHKIAKICTRESTKCNHVEVQISHKDHLNNAEEWFRNASSSWFCIQPPGSSPTRRSTFDCLLAGSIPVFFSQATVDMLPWKNVVDPSLYSVMAPEDLNFLKMLSKIDVPERLRFLRNIEQFHRLFQYSTTPLSGMIRWDNVRKIDSFDDAFTFSLKALIKNFSDRKLLHNVSI